MMNLSTPSFLMYKAGDKFDATTLTKSKETIIYKAMIDITEETVDAFRKNKHECVWDFYSALTNDLLSSGMMSKDDIELLRLNSEMFQSSRASPKVSL